MLCKGRQNGIYLPCPHADIGIANGYAERNVGRTDSGFLLKERKEAERDGARLALQARVKTYAIVQNRNREYPKHAWWLIELCHAPGNLVQNGRQTPIKKIVTSRKETIEFGDGQSVGFNRGEIAMTSRWLEHDESCAADQDNDPFLTFHPPTGDIIVFNSTELRLINVAVTKVKLPQKVIQKAKTRHGVKRSKNPVFANRVEVPAAVEDQALRKMHNS